MTSESRRNYRQVAQAAMPLAIRGEAIGFQAIAFSCGPPSEDILVLARRPHGEVSRSPLVRIHSGCVTGDALGSLRCDCGFQLQAALQQISDDGDGLLVYLPAHEGRGIGLANKIRAYALQDHGRDTVDANLELGWPADARNYDGAVAALRGLGIGRLRLLSNNPSKIRALNQAGIEVVERVPISGGRNEHNRGYIETKVSRMGHLFDDQPG